MVAQAAQAAFLFTTDWNKMKLFAVLSGNVVENVIVAESKEIAELVASRNCYEYTDENPAGIGWSYDDATGRFISPSPFLSWSFNRDIWVWEAPIPMPNDGAEYSWDETSQQWTPPV